MTQVSSDDLLRWGLPRLRDLPWRRTRDPWEVLVSEVMLQQTQVERVIPKYIAFLAEFPTTDACAAASLADVLRLWQGLGYPRRARNLHAAAREVVAIGTFPSTLAALRALPGIGEYTARAVLAFAFEIDAAVVDTNIARVFARFTGRRLTQREVQAAADSALPPGGAWAWNQTIMDLGAAMCRPSRPACGECPLRPSCAWHGAGADPAVGSAAVSGKQARFEGSDRQGRGRLMRAMGVAPVAVANLDAAMGWPGQRERAERVAGLVVADGLAAFDGRRYTLPL